MTQRHRKRFDPAFKARVAALLVQCLGVADILAHPKPFL
jgi:transposase-like protein